MLYSHRGTLQALVGDWMCLVMLILQECGREMKCRREARNMVSAITSVLCVITERLTGTALLCYVLLCD